MYLIDTRKYDDSFLLAKILEKVDITNEEKKKLFKHFEKPGVVDVVEVVRCKDCQHWHESIFLRGEQGQRVGLCDCTMSMRDTDFFCKEGRKERKCRD